MNQSLLHAEVLLRHQARVREKHVAEGRVLHALNAAAPGRGGARQAASVGSVDEPSAVRARISRLWRGFWLPGRPEAKRPLHADSPLLQAAE